MLVLIEGQYNASRKKVKGLLSRGVTGALRRLTWGGEHDEPPGRPTVPLRAAPLPKGTVRTCRSWLTEAAYRMLLNNLDPEVAERREELIVYGGSGRRPATRSASRRFLRELRELGDDETLLVQSGKPVGVLRTHPTRRAS